MSLPRTEATPDPLQSIDALPQGAAIAALIDAQVSAATAVRGASDAITKGAAVIAHAVKSGGRLHYVAAGSSGLMALADGAELPGTFGISQDQIRIHMAGGVPVDGAMPGDTEDDISAAAQIAGTLQKTDVVIAVSASGTTPFAVDIVKRAAKQGHQVIAITNAADTPLASLADTAIALPTPPEVLAGSTRLGAGTAQKIALNTMSTLAGVMLGHVYRGMMVNLHADNIKLRQRAVRIVMAIAEIDASQAQSALETAQGNTKLAILIASGCASDAARTLLHKHDGHLGPCLDQIPTLQTT